MEIILDLPPELAEELTAEASRLGLPLSEYVVRVLSRRGLADSPKRGAEVLAYWQVEGLVGTRPDITDGEAFAREIRRRAEKRERS